MRSDEEQAEALLQRLRKDGATIAVAESCTGGLVGAALTAVPGASEAFWGGITTYTDQAKTDLLGLDPNLLTDGHGAVSGATAEAMAHGARDRFQTDLAIAVTGIAGPGGGTKSKPVGTVWIATLGPGDLVRAHKYQFDGDRDAIRRQSVAAALEQAFGNLAEAEEEQLV